MACLPITTRHLVLLSIRRANGATQAQPSHGALTRGRTSEVDLVNVSAFESTMLFLTVIKWTRSVKHSSIWFQSTSPSCQSSILANKDRHKGLHILHFNRNAIHRVPWDNYCPCPYMMFIPISPMSIANLPCHPKEIRMGIWIPTCHLLRPDLCRVCLDAELDIFLPIYVKTDESRTPSSDSHTSPKPN